MLRQRKISTMISVTLALFSSIIFIPTTYAADITVPVYLVTDTHEGTAIGTITLKDAACGVLLTPNLHGLPAGVHGFHLHANPSCDNKGMAAGDHYDPQHTNAHDGPYNNKGHMGDLPILVVDNQGNATLPMLAPRLKVNDFLNHALIIHEGGDNYADQPGKNGGGGARIACGIIMDKQKATAFLD